VLEVVVKSDAGALAGVDGGPAMMIAVEKLVKL
jgi:hypothetical protein